MDEILKNLTSPSWWFAAVVVGIGVNILTASVQVGAANLTSKGNRLLRLRSYKAKRKHLAAVQAVRRDARLFQLYISHKAHLGASSVWWMVAAVMFVGLACIMYIPADPSSRWADLAKWQVTAARRAGLVSALVCMLFSVLRMKRALDLNAIVTDSVVRPKMKEYRAKMRAISSDA